MLNSKPLDKIIFLDIETVPQFESFFDMTPKRQKLFTERFKKEYNEMGLGTARRVLNEAGVTLGPNNTTAPEEPEDEADHRAKLEILYNNKAALHAEFGKIVCISIGWFKENPVFQDLKKLTPEMELAFETKSFYGDDEKKLILEFWKHTASVINAFAPKMSLCAHNGTNFDFPFLAKRCVLNGLPIPTALDIGEKKPWDVTWLIDTKMVWKFGVYDNTVSLALLCDLFDVPTPKDDIDGSQVRDVYYNEKDVVRIAKYCEKDVAALATVYLRMKSISNNLQLC